MSLETDEMAAESATLADADRHMHMPLTCMECRHHTIFGTEDVCCVERDDGSDGYLYVIDHPEDDQSGDDGCGLWEPRGIRTSKVEMIVSDDTIRAARAMGMHCIFLGDE